MSENSFLSPEIQAALRNVAKSFGEVQAKMAETSAPFSEYVPQVNLKFNDLAENLRKLPPVIQEELIAFAEQGWYISFNMDLSLLAKAYSLYQGGNIEEANQVIEQYYTDQLDEIEKQICSQFPHRALILSSAFSAHRGQDYVLSVPVFLAQTDGICIELTGLKVFNKNKGRPLISQYIESIPSDRLLSVILQPLAITMPISTNTGELESVENVLNRHAVLHGISVEYGTSENSLKAISMLNYVVGALADLQRTANDYGLTKQSN